MILGREKIRNSETHDAAVWSCKWKMLFRPQCFFGKLLSSRRCEVRGGPSMATESFSKDSVEGIEGLLQRTQERARSGAESMEESVTRAYHTQQSDFRGRVRLYIQSIALVCLRPHDGYPRETLMRQKLVEFLNHRYIPIKRTPVHFRIHPSDLPQPGTQTAERFELRPLDVQVHKIKTPGRRT